MPSRKVVVGSIVALVAVVTLGVGLGVSGVFSNDNGGDPSSLTLREFGTLQPTITAMPSPSPSISPAPSFRPSSSPSIAPTTAEPSSNPSSAPTASPTKAPTVSPAPTDHPSPSPTSSPTAPPIPKGYTFRLKLYWRKGFYWQEETFEREWCLECASCVQLTTSGFGIGCSAKPNDQCEKGDQLWLQRCRKNGGNAKFKIAERDNKRGDLFQVANTNLCVERKDGRYLALDRCNRNLERQRWLGFRPHEQPFSWQPLEDTTELRCVTQHHHPKAKEIIYASDCYTAHFWDTGYWEAYPLA